MSNGQQIDGNGNPVTARPSGWYWVRVCHRIGSGEWEPAKYVAEIRSWYSIEWFGLPDGHLTAIGERIEAPTYG